MSARDWRHAAVEEIESAMRREDWETGHRLASAACDRMFAEESARTGRSVAELEREAMFKLGCALEELNGVWPFETDPRLPVIEAGAA
ncbi:hypothetical protein ACIBCH_41805 [Amycolatopsis thailandensis]|uniref:hypothetical protein n=1 Tax=Amycolatopsis thailandensis TaxID=589330 RepID=UPI0037B11222